MEEKILKKICEFIFQTFHFLEEFFKMFLFQFFLFSPQKFHEHNLKKKLKFLFHSFFSFSDSNSGKGRKKTGKKSHKND